MSYAETFMDRLIHDDWKCAKGQHHSITAYASDYAAGQGYSLAQGQRGILTANWNDCTRWNGSVPVTTVCDCMPRIAKIAERAGYEIGWEDEWSNCSDCGKLIREQPDSYGWRPQFVIGDGEILCSECADPRDVVRDCIGNYSRALPEFVDAEKYGYYAVPAQFETGFHPGQDDEPRTIADKLRAAGVKRFVFSITGVEQFDVSWIVNVRKRDMRRASAALSA